MPDTCPNPWYYGGCEPTIEYLWHGTDSWERWVLYTLALLFTYVLIIAARISYRYHSARPTEPADHACEEFQRARRELIVELIPGVSSIRSVAAAAPYLGSLGACFGILGGFTGYSGTPHGFVVLAAVTGMTALLSTVAGILVASTAAFFYNLLRMRIEAPGNEVLRKWRKRTWRGSRIAQSLPLAHRISKFSFALTAVPLLALYILSFLSFASFGGATGLRVGLAPDRCEPQSSERVIVLHVTEAGKIFINTEEEDWNRLAVRLSEINSPRTNHTLYFSADDDVPVQTAVRAIDVVDNLSLEDKTGHLDVKLKLITPAAIKAHCSEMWHVSRPEVKLTSRSSLKIAQ
jgi:biopolymer transport protein ExbD